MRTDETPAPHEVSLVAADGSRDFVLVDGVCRGRTRRTYAPGTRLFARLCATTQRERFTAFDGRTQARWQTGGYGHSMEREVRIDPEATPVVVPLRPN